MFRRRVLDRQLAESNRRCLCPHLSAEFIHGQAGGDIVDTAVVTDGIDEFPLNHTEGDAVVDEGFTSIWQRRAGVHQPGETWCAVGQVERDYVYPGGEFIVQHTLQRRHRPGAKSYDVLRDSTGLR